MQFVSIIGLAVVGGMVASMVPIVTPLKFTTGEQNLFYKTYLIPLFLDYYHLYVLWEYIN